MVTQHSEVGNYENTEARILLKDRLGDTLRLHAPLLSCTTTATTTTFDSMSLHACLNSPSILCLEIVWGTL